ncbi:hypothetical protein POJ06DRAFT_263073 [Lipomyces tetrasporus]|uniref:Uncharacterized protein n=1 Tax=Lipomyces tetrasporus TaxID=54092 RepID=A0AAD7QK36_9ASCO|nr:uncharacterized protein POJ06DRAFT_263073 [Lipomyces tetrasporus]KAJ8096661.1 hypothetical protein POJ06DRAFT_263073 [Lipomyces tetrasporus]
MLRRPQFLKMIFEIFNLFENVKARQYSPNASPLCMLADRGFAELIRGWVPKEPNVHILGERYKYPLFAALANSLKDVVAALLGLPSSFYEECDITKGLKYKKRPHRIRRSNPVDSGGSRRSVKTSLM